jgi:hypothetical protein
MTEAEWLTCADPKVILNFVWGKASERKRRLFEVACCRSIWQLLTDERSRQAVEAAERYADALATEDELEAASTTAHDVWNAEAPAPVWEAQGYPSSASFAAYNVALPRGWWGGAPAFQAPHRIVLEVASTSGIDGGAAQCALLRDIYGELIRRVVVNRSWSPKNGDTVWRLAQLIYDDRAFERLPTLADALEDAGCDNADILTHCRGPGPHVRGCWVVDLLLGKE